MNQKWQIGLVIVGVVFAVAIITEQLLQPRRAPEAPSTPPKAPEGALDPSAAAYRPTGTAWEEYLKRKPLKVGDRAPVVTVSDARGKAKTPLPRKPALWGILCGCNDCADAGYQIFEIMKEMGKEQIEAVVFVSNSTDYVQERMRQSFGLRCRIIDDGNGDYYRMLRAPGATAYSRLPMVWGIDRNGKVVFFARTRRGDSVWTLEVKTKLGLKQPAVPPIE